jgi:predicted extracellular nuclease
MKISKKSHHLLSALVGLIMVLTLTVSPKFTPPTQAASATVFINEIHYDNASTDVGEAIEIAGPAGTDLTGWSIALYNGSSTQLNVYDTIPLGGVIPDQDNGYGTLEFPRAGIQNGSPDGLALVDGSNTVIQFLCYEGTFTAASGPAAGMTCTDIGVSEGGSDPIGESLQLAGTGKTYDDFTWTGPIPNTFGAVNTGQTFGTPVPPSITVFVNEIHYDNTGTDSGEAIEIAGPACTDLTGWSIVLYNGNGGGAYDTATLSGPIPSQSGGYGVVVVNYPTNGIQNGSPDGIALVDAGNHVVQFLSYEGAFTATDGPANGMLSEDIGVSEASSTPVGDSLQLTGSGSTYTEFAWASPAAATFGTANTGQTFTGGGTTNPCGVGAANPSLVSLGGSSLLTVAVTPGSNPDSTGLSVSCDLSAIGGSSSQPFFDDGTNGDVTAGDDTFSYQATVAANTAASLNNLLCTVSDAEARTGSASISLSVILPIGTVQGSVSDTDNGATFASPYVGQTVVIQGVIYEKIIARTSSGSSTYGFFIQNTAATADSDPNSSDGIFVYMSYYTDLIGGYIPQVGDEIILQGRVSEYFNLTELSSARALEVVSSVDNLDAEVPAFDVNPPSDLADANRYWERREGMRGQIPADSIVLNGRNVFASTADAEVWVARPDSVIAQRTDPYARRAFRDAHPLDDNYDPNNWDGNGYRILMGSLGIKAAADDNTAMIAPARTFNTLTNSPVGGVYYSFGKYSIQTDQQIALSEGDDPALNAPPQTFDRTQEYSIVDYNLENLYDYRNNPFSGCDFAGDSGCDQVFPFIGDVTPPYDYVPASDAAYQARLNDIAIQIINDLHSPDILMVQEVENQDICTVTGSDLTCGTTDNADGQPDDLQDLALKIASLGGPTYAAAFDRDSSDLRGILPAFMYRTDRVQLLPAAGDPILGSSPAIAGYTAVPYDSDVSNPKTLNAVLPSGVSPCETSWVFPRAPDIGLFRIWRDGIGASVFTDVYVIDNHFKSGPDSCVAHRTEQAKYNAAIVSFLQASNPNARVVVGGDLNVYPRPDDPFAPIGQPGSSDQLGSLYDPALGLTNLWDVLLSQVPESAYSYVYQGQAQTLDQIFTNQPMRADLEQIRSAHINSDFPADYPDDVARGTSDHDPQVASFSDLPTIDRLESLVMYYDANGMITGNNTTTILLDRLEKARRFQQNGQQDAYMDQLQAFIEQIYDFTPQFITQEAADALTQETTLLQSLP